jgi:hypothetical protein
MGAIVMVADIVELPRLLWHIYITATPFTDMESIMVPTFLTSENKPPWAING